MTSASQERGTRPSASSRTCNSSTHKCTSKAQGEYLSRPWTTRSTTPSARTKRATRPTCWRTDLGMGDCIPRLSPLPAGHTLQQTRASSENSSCLDQELYQAWYGRCARGSAVEGSTFLGSGRAHLMPCIFTMPCVVDYKAQCSPGTCCLYSRADKCSLLTRQPRRAARGPRKCATYLLTWHVLPAQPS
jgi:hypothetical protein